MHHWRDGTKATDARPVHAAVTAAAAFLGKNWHDSDGALSCTANKRYRQRVCPLGSTKILPKLDMRWVWRKGRFPCLMLKQHTYSQASMFVVFIAVLGLNRSQSHLEGSWVWDGLCVEMSACAEIQLGYKQGIPWRNRKIDDLPADKQDSGKNSTWSLDWKASLESAWFVLCFPQLADRCEYVRLNWDLLDLINYNILNN